MTESVEWAVGGANGLYNVDTSNIMAAGYSCGGTEAYQMQDNSAVTLLGIFNSGLLDNYGYAESITKPIMYALGGPNDIAYQNVSDPCPRRLAYCRSVGEATVEPRLPAQYTDEDD
jgi:dienelactone hydrolase